MLLVCPNCATSYGVEMASLRLARGGTRQVRCCRCRWVWHAQLSYADKLMVAADAVLPVRRAMLAVAQVAAEAAPVDAAASAARNDNIGGRAGSRQSSARSNGRGGFPPKPIRR